MLINHVSSALSSDTARGAVADPLLVIGRKSRLGWHFPQTFSENTFDFP